MTPEPLASHRTTRCTIPMLPLILAGALMAGCADDPAGPGTRNGKENEGPRGPESEVDCSLTPRQLVERLEVNLPASIPSREQLDCYAGQLVRAPRPAFWISVGHQTFEAPENPNSGPTDWKGTWPLIQEYVQLLGEWPEANVITYPLNEVPPYVTMGGKPFYPYTAETWDQKMRAAETLGLYFKSLGKPLTVHYFTPPNLEEWENSPIPVMRSKEEFLDWWRTYYIPERVSLAKLAERLKARYFQP